MNDEFYSLEQLEEMWQPLYCDSCEQHRDDIVKQNEDDGKLICKTCWEDMCNNARKYSSKKTKGGKNGDIA